VGEGKIRKPHTTLQGASLEREMRPEHFSILYFHSSFFKGGVRRTEDFRNREKKSLPATPYSLPAGRQASKNKKGRENPSPAEGVDSL
jgi:hypothetical protein